MTARRLFLFATWLPLLAAAAPVTDVNVNVDLTPAGKKVTPATPAKPAYYVPVIGGFHEEGDLVAGTTPPPPDFVVAQFTKALTAQGYLAATDRTPSPTLLLVFHWGSLNPDIMDTPDGPILLNEKRMAALVAGNTLDNLNPFSERQDVVSAAYKNRYFVMVSAYDYAAAKQQKKICLWRAKMSVPSAHVTLAEVVSLLIESGAPMFGRETVRPVFVTKPIKRQGTVNLGDLQVEEYMQSGAKPAEPPAHP